MGPTAYVVLSLAHPDHDQHRSGRQGSATHPRRNRMFLRDFRLDVPDLEHALVARIGRRLDEHEKASCNQEGAHDLHYSHVITSLGTAKTIGIVEDSPRDDAPLLSSRRGVYALNHAVDREVIRLCASSSRLR